MSVFAREVISQSMQIAMLQLYLLFAFNFALYTTYSFGSERLSYFGFYKYVQINTIKLPQLGK